MDFLLIFIRLKKRNKMIKYTFFLFLLLFSSKVFAQNDTLKLNIEQVLEIVKRYHPVVKQGYISIEKSKANITVARGAFNPIIGNYISNKTFDNTQYYNYTNPNITIPTWFGVEVSAGLENLSGNRFDPSETVGKSSYIGASIPLLKNLTMDKRRAYLKQANLYNEMAKTEQQSTINNILMDATSNYWDWVNAYQAYVIVEKNLVISRNRFEMVKKSFQNGEHPAIDTIEALSQFQNFEFQKNESWLKLQKTRLELSAFLWQDNNVPYQLLENVIPQNGWDNETNIKLFSINQDELLTSARQFHPDLRIYNQKLDVLEIDKKLKFQELLPKADFRYNHLSRGYNVFTNEGLLFQNNYQYGLKLEMPLLLSQGRGEFKIAKLKIEETQIAQSQKLLSVELKVKNYYYEFQNIRNQVQLQRNILTNVEKLLQAEETLFLNGESSMFLINSRENKVFEAERKLAELKTKYFNTIYALQWSAGLLM
jgi:outer membrane protein TolC